MMKILQRKDQGQIKLPFVLNSVKGFSSRVNLFFFDFKTTYETTLSITIIIPFIFISKIKLKQDYIQKR
jgi:hypothetical protein